MNFLCVQVINSNDASLISSYIPLAVIHPDSGASKALSHINPWNFTARMMIIHPISLFKLLGGGYDVVHVVMPANLSGMFVLAAFKLMRCMKVSLARPCLTCQ